MNFQECIGAEPHEPCIAMGDPRIKSVWVLSRECSRAPPCGLRVLALAKRVRLLVSVCDSHRAEQRDLLLVLVYFTVPV